MICISFETILNAIIAIGAIAAAVFAGWAVLQTKKFRQEEEESRRAFLAIGKGGGKLIVPEVVSFNAPWILSITLQNYGINPLKNATIKIFGIEFDRIDNKPQILYTFETNSINPISQNADLELTFDLLGVDQEKATRVLNGFIMMYISYHDIKLNRKFDDEFYWKPNEKRILSEVKEEDYFILKSLKDKLLELNIKETKMYHAK